MIDEKDGQFEFLSKTKYLNVKNCIDESCDITPTLGYISNKPIACIKHSNSNMKNVTTRKCINCETKQPSYNFINLPPKYCFDCKFDDADNKNNKMINTKRKRKRNEIN